MVEQPPLSIPNALLLLDRIHQCVKNVVVSHSEQNLLRQSLLSNRPRAELMHVIAQLGDAIATLPEVSSNVESKSAVVEWESTRGAFMNMLES